MDKNEVELGDNKGGTIGFLPVEIEQGKWVIKNHRHFLVEPITG